MKIEVAPWIKDYVCEIDDLYTELTLEKIQCKVTQENIVILNNYNELFRKRKRKVPFCPTGRNNILIPGKRLLFKGEPGMGKATLVKIIECD